MSTENSQITDVSIYIAALTTSYKPANCATETTHWLSTQEVYDAVKKIDPGAKVAVADIHDALHNAGFKYQNRPGAQGLDFRWMMIAK